MFIGFWLWFVLRMETAMTIEAGMLPAPPTP